MNDKGFISLVLIVALLLIWIAVPQTAFSSNRHSQAAPHIDSLSPSSGPAGTVVTIRGSGFGPQPDPSSLDTYVLIDGFGTSFMFWKDTEIEAIVPDDAGTGPVVVTVAGVSSNQDVIFQVNPASYFAEGTCRPNFDTYFCLMNPDTAKAQVTLTYMKGDGTSSKQDVEVAPRSRATVIPRAVLGTGDDAAHDFSTKVECTNGRSIIAERPMYFNYKGVWTGGHDAMGGQPDWFFSFIEGTCRPNFETYFCIQNLERKAVDVTLVYRKVDGGSVEDNVSVPPLSRVTVNPRIKLGTGDDAAHDFSTSIITTEGARIVVERPMYFNYKGVWTGGHDGCGRSGLFGNFAEGSCRPGFDPYICLLPSLFGHETATANITYLKGDGTQQVQSIEVQNNRRTTVRVKEFLGEGDDAAHDFSAIVGWAGGSGQKHADMTVFDDLLTERSMYFDYHGWTGGHNVTSSSTASTFDFAEGTCRPGFDTYFCILNSANKPADVKITYLKGDGTNIYQTLTVPADSRATVRTKDKLGEGDDAAHDYSARVESTNGQPIVVERPMYFNYKGIWDGGHDVVGKISSE